MSKNDIILIMSDQHNAHYTSLFNEDSGLTPNLKEIKPKSRVFTNAYCNAPLCVPSRMSFLTGELPSETKILDNDSVLNSDEITLAHKLSMLGYKTILVGRMHFKGLDQFHGFDERYVGDITTQFWGQKRSDLGDYHPGFKAKTCQEVFGTGYSPVLDYDEQVYRAALELIKEECNQPRFIVIGFYAPHFPYISKNTSNFTSKICKDDINASSNKYYGDMIQKTNLKTVQAMDEHYMEMIHDIDSYIGDIYRELRLRGKESVFIYTSDHGDQLGRRSIFGKKVMYQDSIKIPMLIENLFKEGVETSNVSLLDLHHWLVEYAETQKKIDFKQDKASIVQQIVEYENAPLWSEAVIKEDYKLVKIGDIYELYDVSENEKLLDHKLNDDIFKSLEKYLLDSNDVKGLLNHYTSRKNINKMLHEHGKNINRDYDYSLEVINKFKINKEKFKGE